jgi:Predicted bile acid beta-glucosidase
MLHYNSEDNIKSGLPLGGIGTGKVEIFPDGLLRNYSNQGNWSSPISEIAGNFFAVDVRGSGESITKILTTKKHKDGDTVERIEYGGEYPFAYLNYIDSCLPVDIKLTAFSPMIPHNYRDSSIPCAIFRFSVKNNSLETKRVSLMMNHKNSAGSWNLGRYNSIYKDDFQTVIVFKNIKSTPDDFSQGDICISTPFGEDVTYINQFNLRNKQFWVDFQNIRMASYKELKENGILSNNEAGKVVEGQAYEPAGSLCVTKSIEPGESKEFIFLLSWFMYSHYIGYNYHNYYKDSVEVSKYALLNLDRLCRESMALNEGINRLNIPDFLKDALINNLYVLTTGSWYGKNGEFALYEASVTCPLMDTLDVRYYCSIVLALLFPELEKQSNIQFAMAARESGYIPHDLGLKRIDMPSDGTTAPPQWKDLCCKYILIIWRNYYLWKNKEYLERLYPTVKKAMIWEMGTDRNGDGLPDNEGADQTYDVWDFYGTNAYTSSIYLAALKAIIEMARICGDMSFADKMQAAFDKGRKSFEGELWNGEYYIACSDGKSSYDSSIAGQLNGQFFSFHSGLGYILNDGRVKKAVSSMMRLNGSMSKFGAVNSVFKDGSVDESNAHSKNIWPGESYLLSALSIYEGMVDEGMELCKKTWENFTDNNKSPWNQPDVINYEDGSFGFGDTYMRNMAVWNVLIALSKYDKSIADFLCIVGHTGNI